MYVSSLNILLKKKKIGYEQSIFKEYTDEF